MRLTEKEISWLIYALRDLTARDLHPEDVKIINSILKKLEKRNEKLRF